METPAKGHPGIRDLLPCCSDLLQGLEFGFNVTEEFRRFYFSSARGALEFFGTIPRLLGEVKGILQDPNSGVEERVCLLKQGFMFSDLLNLADNVIPD